MTESDTVLGPLEPLLADPTIHTIMVNGYDHIYVSRQAFLMEEIPEHFRDQDQLIQVIDQILKPTGRVANETSPIVDVRLQDWTLIQIVMPPVAPDGPVMTIRKAVSENQIPTFDTLVEVGSLSADMVKFLRACVKARVNIVVCGATGSGKTTLLNLIANLIHPDARILLVEQEPDLVLEHRNIVRLTARPASADGKGEITLQRLVESATRMRPDRIVCSEVFDGEVYPLLQAMSSGVEGSMFALHATSPRDALSRLEVMVASANPALPLPSIRQQIARAVNIIIELQIMEDGWRRVQRITAITGLSGDFIQTADIFEFIETGTRADETIAGDYVANPNLRRIMDRLASGEKRWVRWAEAAMPHEPMPHLPSIPPMPPVPPSPLVPPPASPRPPEPPAPPPRRRG
jgi:pilus assembly protein CpaF